MNHRWILTSLALLSVVLHAAGQAGQLDPAFDTDGQSHFPQVGGAFPIAIGAGTNGTVAVAGYTWLNGYDIIVAKLNDDGSLNSSFGNGGVVTTDLGSVDDEATAVVVDAQDRIIAGGWTQTSDREFALVRYLPDGTLDPSFGGDGAVWNDLGQGDDRCFALALQPDGKILAAGVGHGAAARMVVLRYNADGTLDNSFDGDGIVLVDSAMKANAIALRPDGRILLLGQYSSGLYLNSCLVQLNSDGSLDGTFGVNGVVYGHLGQPYGTGERLALAPDGKAVVAGDLLTGGYSYLVARYTANGELDPTFNQTGCDTLSIQGYDHVTGVAVQTDGRIVVSGDTYDGLNSASHHLVNARYMPDGQLDAGYGSAGIVLTEGGSGWSTAIDPQDRILYATTNVANGIDEFVVLRFLSGQSIGITEYEGTTFQLFPQPAEDRCMIELPVAPQRPTHARFYNAMGAQVLVRLLTGRTTTVDLGTLVPGSYVCVIDDDRTRHACTLVKQ